MPSARIEASASSSAADQSTARSSGAASIEPRRSRPRSSFLWTVKPAGTVARAALSAVSCSSGTAVRTFGGGAARRHHRHVGHVVLLGLELGVGAFEHARRARPPARRARAAASWPLGHQRRGVLLPHGRVLRDLLIQQRLRERRLVALVVAVAAVADQVDEEVEREALPVGPRQPRRLDARLGVVGVDVHDRHLEAARQAAGVAGRERLVRLGGEAELVVGDDVDGAADVPAGEPREVERLGDDSLAGERGIAVDEDAEHVPGAQRRRAGRVHARSPPLAPCRPAADRPPRDGSGSAASR